MGINSEGQIIHVSLVKREGSGEKLKQPEQSSQSQVTASSSSVEVEKAPTVELMEIDKILEKEDGLIKRGRSQL